MTIKLIIGLRNPGAAYAHTRHNAGEWFVAALAKQYQVTFKTEKKLQNDVARIELAEVTCQLALPLTFMNHSGLSVRSISQFYRIEPQHMLIVHDELDLPAGVIRLKTGGGHGGHNGLRDIISQLGTSSFHRLRIGIQHPGHKDLVLDYVLGKPSTADKQKMDDAILRGIAVMPTVLCEGVAKAMNELNTQ